MKVLKILASDAARALQVRPVVGGKIYGINLIRALESRYGFMEAPKTLADFDFAKGVKFRHGFFDGHVVDVEFVEGGIRTECSDGTDICDALMDDIINWAAKDAGIKIEATENLRAYNSVLECELDIDLDSSFERFLAIGRDIGSKIGSYGGQDSPYRPVALGFKGSLEGTGPSQFRIERRVNQPFSSNVYFSSAPLSTADHVEILTNLEKLMA